MPSEVGEQFISIETKDKCPRCGKINHIWYEEDKDHTFICKECSSKKYKVEPISSDNEKKPCSFYSP